MTTPQNSDGRTGRHSQPIPVPSSQPYGVPAAHRDAQSAAGRSGDPGRYPASARTPRGGFDPAARAPQGGFDPGARAPRDPYARQGQYAPQATYVPGGHAGQGGYAGHGGYAGPAGPGGHGGRGGYADSRAYADAGAYGAAAGAGYPQPYGPPSIPSQRPSDSGAVRPLAPVRLPRNGFGTTALVLGIIGLLFAFIPFIGVIAWPLVILGLIFGGLGIAKARSGAATNQGVAISGTVLSAIGLIVCIVWAAAFSSAVSSIPTTPAAPAAGGTVSASTGTGGAAGASGGAAFPGSTSDDVTGNAGDTLTVGDMQITATAVKPGDSTIGRTLCSTVTYRNTGSAPSSFNGLFDWKLQDPAGAALGNGFTGSNTILSSGQLAPGGTTSGDVCFDRTGGSGQYVLLYDPMDFSSARGAWLNQLG